MDILKTLMDDGYASVEVHGEGKNSKKCFVDVVTYSSEKFESKELSV